MTKTQWTPNLPTVRSSMRKSSLEGDGGCDTINRNSTNGSLSSSFWHGLIKNHSVEMISLIHFPNPRAVDSTTTPIHDTDTHTHTQTQSHTESSHEHIRRCWRLWMLDAGSHRNTIITIKKSIVIMMIIIVGCDGKINRFMRAHNRKTKWKKHFGGGFCFFFF